MAANAGGGVPNAVRGEHNTVHRETTRMHWLLLAPVLRPVGTVGEFALPKASSGSQGRAAVVIAGASVASAALAIRLSVGGRLGFAAGVIRVLNIEADFPSLDEARRRVAEEIRRAKREGVRVLKVIHGYGSSGKGGTLNHGLRKSFALRKQEQVIKDFVPGESFEIFNATTLALLEAFPALRGDPDLGQANLGITMVWLK
ncbi:MAG: hypothetical protein RLY20_58 [Verrucomicrobiota bacterium]|jgi:hypothetical protein